MTDYRTLWADLGMDLERHDQLLDVLSQGYSQIFLSQSNRPEGMKYFDFVVSEAHGLRIQELADHRKNGGTVVGAFCVFVPEDIVLAAGGIPIGLCAGAEFPIPDSEGLIPRNTCPLIRATLGFKMSRVCPYMQMSNFLVGETTCDGKKKMYEVLNEYHPTYVMEVPQKKTQAARNLFLSEITAFKDKMEAESGKKITAEGLAAATSKVEAKKQALRRLHGIRAADPVPISGRDALLASQISFYDDIDRFTAKVNELAGELESRAERGEGVFPKGTPRILLVGTPIPFPDWKIHTIVESAGGVIIGEESCVGSRYYSTTTPSNDGALDGQLQAIADRHLGTHCACFTPNEERVGDIIEMAKALNADGVINYSLAFCQTYAAEAVKMEKALAKEGIPTISLESDFSMNDQGQLSTRVQAFIEMISSRLEVRS
ncbi:MAG: double-cubane-cluster-containing anaerobic reductase [Armatimonadota bacterium]|nr:double-cubane-cluster-containing anaerobic reductase [Armatimonadota bacterium]